ncbi:MAG: HNH endonuclease [Alphaproteobacteria bacterium]
MTDVPKIYMEKFIDTNVWVPVHTLPGFESCIEYYVSRDGQVKSTKGSQYKILKHKRHKDGYPMVTLTQRIGRKKPIYVCVHKLVAFAFLEKPPTPYGVGKGCSMIDHIDEDKTNCNVDNLQWVSRKENNTKHPYQRRRKNTPEEDAMYKERQRIAKRDYMRRKRAEEKKAKIE